MKKQTTLIALAAGAGIAGLTYAFWPKKKIPASAIVDPFDMQRYLGKWNEIARLPNEDGKFKVVTRAFNAEKNKPVEATGTIKFKGPQTRGQLEVAYYLPIYLDYNVIGIDEDYRYALVSGSSLGYLWLLSREDHIPADIQQQFLDKASGLGFDISKLEWMDS
jgi:apolipoprotein D and lipocalin family protein